MQFLNLDTVVHTPLWAQSLGSAPDLPPHLLLKMEKVTRPQELRIQLTQREKKTHHKNWQQGATPLQTTYTDQQRLYHYIEKFNRKL